MERSEMINKLGSLVQLDIDAIHAYQQAIRKIEVEDVKNQLTLFLGDHQRHVENISAEIRKMGGQPPQFSPDFKGFLLEGFTTLRSITGDEGALKAMQVNEKITNSTYDKALAWDLPSDILEIVKRNREDERRHLEYIDRAIQNRLWEKKAA